MPNEDEVAHNAFRSPTPDAFNLGSMHKAEQGRHLPGARVVDVQCSMHRRMHATIIVSPSPYHTTPSGGAPVGARYEIKNVPAGSYELRGWSQELGEFKGSRRAEKGPVDVDVALTTGGGR